MTAYLIGGVVYRNASKLCLKSFCSREKRAITSELEWIITVRKLRTKEISLSKNSSVRHSSLHDTNCRNSSFVHTAFNIIVNIRKIISPRNRKVYKFIPYLCVLETKSITSTYYCMNRSLHSLIIYSIMKMNRKQSLFHVCVFYDYEAA